MYKKIFSVAFLLVGVLFFVGAGCGNKNLTVAQKQTNTNPTAGNETEPYDIAPPAPGLDKNSTDIYVSAEEIAAPAGLASELKSIFSEACGGAKLTIFNHNLPTQGTDELIYVWKNKPTEEELTSAFEKKGYKIEFSGGIGIAEKGNSTFSVDWYYQLEDHEIIVLAGWVEK